MEVIKQDYLKVRESGRFDLKTLFFGLSLNKTFKATEYELANAVNIFQRHMMGYRYLDRIFSEVKLRLDNYFNITTLNYANGEEIRVVQ